MAYVKTNWQDGVSGNTKIDANKLNNIENGVYNNDINISSINSQLNIIDENINDINEKINFQNTKLTAFLSSNQYLAYKSTQVKIPLDTVYNSIGSSLTFDSTNNSIKIGSGISKIKVSGSALLRNTSSSTATSNCYLFKNETGFSLQTIQNASNNLYGQVVFPPIIMNVNANDLISLRIFSDANANTIQMRGATDWCITYLTVEVIE